jgi:replicative DNA helicase
LNAVPVPDSFVIEVEQEVLGCLLMGGEFRRVASILQCKHFVEPFHGVIFDAMRLAHERYNSTSLPTVLKMIPKEVAAKFSAQVNAPIATYLTNMTSATVYGPPSIEVSAKRVVEQWARLQIAHEAGRLQSAANDPGSDPAQIASYAGQAFEEILADTRRGVGRKSRVSLAIAIDSAFDAATEARKRGSGLTGITWGLTDLNRLTGGMQRRDLTLIGARPSMGKTTFAVSVGISAAKAGAGVGMLSLEMDRDKIAARAVSDIAYDWHVKIPYIDIIRGTFDDGLLDAVRSATQDVGRLPFWIDDQAGITLSDIRVKTEAMLKTADEFGAPLGILVIDHLGLIRASQRYSGNRTNEIAELTAGLKSLAREYDIGVILLSQLNRALEQRPDKRPQLSDLRDSGAIEQDADTIIFLHRDAYYLDREKGGSPDAEAERTAKLIDKQYSMDVEIAKQRNGPIKRIEVFVDMACCAVRNAAQR